LRKYYDKHDPLLPTDFYLREIAVQPLHLDTYVRHLAFSSISELKNYILNNIPRHIYYSSARYQEPGNPIMDEKKWLGSDLVFDIDSNDIPECIENNMVIQQRFCKKCGYKVDQQDVKTCPNCGSELARFEHVEPRCIDMAKEHAMKLMDILEQDFGFTNISIAFSGHRGFHIVVELDEESRYMTTDDRREIVSYIKLDEQQINYIVENFFKGFKKAAPLPPRITDSSIRRRIALALMKYVEGDVKAYIMGLKPAISFIEAQKACSILLEHINEISRTMSIAIDPKVTIDTTHLVRIPNSINGKTGWIVFSIRNLDLNDFEFSPEVVKASNDKLKIKFITSIPRVTVIDTQFEFSKGDEVVLEYPYASYFVFKEVAIAISIVR